MGWLFDAIRRWRRNRSRAVFRFFDGRRTRAVDPYAVWRHLDQHKTFKWEHLEDTDAGDYDAANTTIDATREAFGIPEFDGGSGTLTSEEVMAIFLEFLEWSRAAKKKRGPGSISSLPTDGASSIAQEARDATMHFSSAST